METQLTQNALQVLNNRYLIKNDEGTVIETPEQMWRRIADTISDSKELADKVYKLMCETKFLPNSPAFNAGTRIHNYSACFALPIHDSMKSIFQTLAISAEIFQSGGGCGYNFSDVRPQGYPVKKTQGIASGPISFASVYNAGIETVKQGGCISATSMIRTSNGLKPLSLLLNNREFEDSNINEHVYSPYGFNTAWLSQDNGMAETIKLITEHGYSLEATYNECVEIIGKDGKNEWKQISEIKAGEWVKVVKGGYTGTDIPILSSTLESHFNDVKSFKFPEYINEELSEILGVYMGNGCANINP